MYPDDAEKQAEMRNILQRKARDNSRTPVQWTADQHAGFTSPGSKPWMRVNDDYKDVNVAAQLSNSDPEQSVLAFWRRGLKHRKIHKSVFVYGDFELVDPDHAKVVAYRRWSKEEAVLVVLNFGGESVVWKGMGGLKVDKWWTGNYADKDLDGKAKEGDIVLRPWEGLIGSLE
jgi:oligo-1,6-glucosidase